MLQVERLQAAAAPSTGNDSDVGEPLLPALPVHVLRSMGRFEDTPEQRVAATLTPAASPGAGAGAGSGSGSGSGSSADSETGSPSAVRIKTLAATPNRNRAGAGASRGRRLLRHLEDAMQQSVRTIVQAIERGEVGEEEATQVPTVTFKELVLGGVPDLVTPQEAASWLQTLATAQTSMSDVAASITALAAARRERANRTQTYYGADGDGAARNRMRYQV